MTIIMNYYIINKQIDVYIYISLPVFSLYWRQCILLHNITMSAQCLTKTKLQHFVDAFSLFANANIREHYMLKS